MMSYFNVICKKIYIKCSLASPVCYASLKVQNVIPMQKTSMMWPSQNFLLYNGTIIKINCNIIKINEWIDN